jgi:hypothetical protein
MNQFLLNSTHYNPATKSIRYDFPFQQSFEKMKVGISDLVMFNQFFNISTEYANNTLTVKVPSSPNIDLIIPDGFYTFTDLNTWLEKELTANGIFQLSGSTKIFPIKFYVSKTSRQNQIILSPYNGSYCQINWTKRLARLYGFAYDDSKNYPKEIPVGSQSITYTQHEISDLYRVNSIYLTCNLIHNIGLAAINDLLVGIPIATTSFGSIISLGESHSKIEYLEIFDSVYKSIEIKIYDQDFNQLSLIDTNLLICLAFVK